MQFNIMAIFLAALSSFLIGGLWYTVLFGKKWQQLVGLSDEAVAQGQTKVFVLSFLLALIMAFNLAAFIGSEANWQFGLAAGLAAGLGWVALAFGINYLFERRPFALFLINAGYNVLTFALMGLIIGAF